MEERHEAHQRARRLPLVPSIRAEALHFLGEIEVVFGLWVVVLLVAMLSFFGWETAKHYLNDGVNYTEPLFVVVIMALAATRPVVLLAEAWMRRVAALGGGTPGAWWLTILVLGPAARIVHHRAGGHDHLGTAARAAVLRPRAQHAR